VRGGLKEIINRSGEKISPGDLDAVLLSNPKVLEAASVGESDAIYGENGQAAVILRPGMEATEGEQRPTAARSSAPSKFPNGST
jgi:acyl-coenzyme A synthetase/AMP-(fatty) acid ligase